MTKKHFLAIARILNDAALINLTTAGEVAVNSDTRWRIAASMATVFYQENPRFDRDRFLAACGFGVKGGR